MTWLKSNWKTLLIGGIAFTVALRLMANSNNSTANKIAGTALGLDLGA